MLLSLCASVHSKHVYASCHRVRREPQTKRTSLTERHDDLRSRCGISTSTTSSLSLNLVAILLPYHAKQLLFSILGKQCVDVSKLLGIVSTVQLLDLTAAGTHHLLR